MPLHRFGFPFFTGLSCAAWLGLASLPAQGQYVPDWTHSIRFGALVGLNISADFKMQGQFGVSSSQPGPVGVSKVDHFYDDGYVRVDSTGNAAGYTSYWGYNSAAQYNAHEQTLTMHSTSAFSTSGSSSQQDNPYLGLELAYAAEPWRWGKTRVGFEFGFGWLPINIKDDQTMAASFDRTAYSFNVGSIIMPTAPYNGGPTGYGAPTIHDIASFAGTTTVPGTIIGSRTLDLSLYTFRLGPSFYWDLSRYFGLSVAAGPAMGIVAGDLKYDETTVFSDGSSTQNLGQNGSTQLTFGGYASAVLTYHVVSHGDVYLGARFMPMESTTINGSGREAKLNLGGQVYVSAGFNWPF